MAKEYNPSTIFGKRLKDARTHLGIAQDRLGVLIGLDEGCSSARISRYETGIHEPPLAISSKLAKTLKRPLAYFYCEDDELAKILAIYADFDEIQKKELSNKAIELLNNK
jgi:transcriptional regulator with XRE-family HTH domain